MKKLRSVSRRNRPSTLEAFSHQITGLLRQCMSKNLPVIRCTQLTLLEKKHPTEMQSGNTAKESTDNLASDKY